MAARLKQKALKCVLESVTNENLLQVLHKTAPEIHMNCDGTNKVRCNLIFNTNQPNGTDEFKDLRSYQGKLVEAGASRLINFTHVSPNGRSLGFEVNVKDFIKVVLSSNPTELTSESKKSKILVEYSSPNIAKQFHVGHFRSTIIGHFITNIKKKMGNNVISLNYLGDWGTQFGLLLMGIRKLGFTEDDLNVDTITKLNKAYVYGNKISMIEEEAQEEAREIFNKLENGDEETVRMWLKIKKFSEANFVEEYKRMGITFDEYEWESMYGRNHAESYLEKIQRMGLLMEDEHGRKVVNVNDNNIPLLKSDGSTLYLLRDICAFFERRLRHNFDKIYYVVDSNQTNYFRNLGQVCELIEPGSSSLMEHVRFGRILGMSTRKGSNVSMSDLYSEAQERMYEKQLATKTTKGTPNLEKAGILGISGIIINDLRIGRKTEYKFDWETALNTTGKSGIQLHYVHCRLCSLSEMLGVTPASECDPDALLEPFAVQLISQIARYEEVLLMADRELEAFYLVKYLFELARAANIAFANLSVRRADSPHLASQRISLFNAVRHIFHDAFKILGLKPVTEM